ncbi:MAG: aminotransferase class I/II-fold pyridoxal phosphate-dependent enzyme [Candidatus Tectomicrobia bacterium]|uniref:Aminotransferase class I/II-fold pyridoxal phosphate-dependent enzyme n=1 Tax=Tectimicrobiota bacterium TaxID=2528274 RepID=A0A932CQS5_UNCTE|nr:aminotransferase class I/II-fold pyridoxal phosphate-dependent enzyme [Candidatus Tectomicrobia bacterium]
MGKQNRRNRNKEEYSIRTHLIHGNYESKKWDYDHHVIPPITSSTTYRLGSTHRGATGFVEFAQDESGKARHVPIYIYDRLDEPSRGMLEENLAYAEGGEIAITFATGMAAISAALGVTVAAGEEIVAHQILYGCTFSLLTNWLPRYGIQTRFCNLTVEGALEEAITEKTRAVYLETPANPNLQMIDIARVHQTLEAINARRPESQRIWMIVDNTFATPYCQRPLQFGADIVVHSLTKDIGGFGTDMGGAVIAPRKLYSHLVLYRKDFGGVLASKSAWSFLVYGLPTLATRMVNQQKSALRVARFLEEHPKVARVFYPGLESFPQYELARRQMVSYDGKFAPGSMIYFLLKEDGNEENAAAEQLMDYLADHSYTITLAVSLGQIKTLIENPFSMSHSSLPPEEQRLRGIDAGGIRLSVGLEDWQDIIEDLGQALDEV